MNEIKCGNFLPDGKPGLCQMMSPCPLHPCTDLMRWLRANDIPYLLALSDKHSFNNHEENQRIILEDRGFTNVKFEMGESDEFGPLTRVMTCRDPEGRDRRFVYG